MKQQRPSYAARGLAAVCISLLLAGPALGQDADPHFYVGVGAGKNKADFNELSALADENELVKVFGGFRLLWIFAVEAFYVDLGRHWATTGPLHTRTDTYGYGAALLVSLPITRKTRLFAKGGEWRWNVRAFTPEMGLTERSHDVDPVIGGGLHFEGENPAASVRLEFERFLDVGTGMTEFKGADFDTVSFSIMYSF